MRQNLLALLLLSGTIAKAQTYTLGTSHVNNQSARSGGCVGITDMDGDGYDDLILINQSKQLYVDYQNSDGTFILYSYGTISTGSQWGFAVGDVKNDGHKDFVSGGSYDGVHYLQITSRGVADAWTNIDITPASIFTQCMNMADINNDGRLDVFACHDDGAPHMWFANNVGTLVANNAYMNFATVPASDMSGNYGSTWTDFDNDGDVDLYITHCRQGVNSASDPRRWNRLFVNNGSNSYSDLAATYGVQNQEQSWASDFADIDNDGDLDLITANHSTTIQLFKNDGTGHYTDFTAGSGLQFSNFFLQTKLEDLDNDGFIDLLNVEGNYYFHNNGNGTFTRITNLIPHPVGSQVLHSFALGDMDHDGDIDVYGSYGTSYVTPSTTYDDELYLNNGNSNHFVNFQLTGSTSNRDGVGARVTIYGAWGKQIREIRAGESYSIVCSSTCHFGLGANLYADSAIVRWPSGTVDKFYNVAADQWVKVAEGQTNRTKLAVVAALGGAYDQASGLMNDGLRSGGYLPLSEPYTALGYTITGANVIRKIPQVVLNVTGNNAIVDWVWLELRDAATPTTVRAARPALLQRDGDVVELDGVKPVSMGFANGSYYVVIKHRNHFGVMTGSALPLTGTSTVVNFKLPATALYGTGALQDVSGTEVMWAGNVVVDNTIKYTGTGNDRDPIITYVGGTTPNNTLTGYRLEDVNLDGVVKYTGASNDRDPILVNVGSTVPTNTRTQQLP